MTNTAFEQRRRLSSPIGTIHPAAKWTTDLGSSNPIRSQQPVWCLRVSPEICRKSFYPSELLPAQGTGEFPKELWRRYKTGDGIETALVAQFQPVDVGSISAP